MLRRSLPREWLPNGQWGLLVEANPKGDGVCGEIFGYCSLLLLFWGREGVGFHRFFCFASEQSPVAEGSTAPRGCIARSLVTALPLACPPLDLFSLWQPEGGNFSRRFTGQWLHAPTATAVLMDRTPGIGAAAAEISHSSFQSGHLLRRAAIQPSALCFGLLSFFGLFFFSYYFSFNCLVTAVRLLFLRVCIGAK